MLIFYDFLMFNFDHVQCQNEFDFPKVGAPTHDFAKFSQKLHEIERIWTTAGGARPPSPLDTPMKLNTPLWTK